MTWYDMTWWHDILTCHGKMSRCIRKSYIAKLYQYFRISGSRTKSLAKNKKNQNNKKNNKISSGFETLLRRVKMAPFIFRPRFSFSEQLNIQLINWTLLINSVKLVLFPEFYIKCSYVQIDIQLLWTNSETWPY